MAVHAMRECRVGDSYPGCGAVEVLYKHLAHWGGASGEAVDHCVDCIVAQLRKEARLPVVERPFRIGGIKHPIELTVRYWADRIHQWSTELLDWPCRRFALGKRATVTRHDCGQLCPGAVGGVNETREHHEFVRQRRCGIPDESEHVGGALKRMGDQAACDRGPYRMQLIVERSRHTKISTSTANGPEQIGLFILACPQHFAFGGDELDGPKIVQR